LKLDSDVSARASICVTPANAFVAGVYVMSNE